MEILADGERTSWIGVTKREGRMRSLSRAAALSRAQTSCAEAFRAIFARVREIRLGELIIRVSEKMTIRYVCFTNMKLTKVVLLITNRTSSQWSRVPTLECSIHLAIFFFHLII